MGVTNALCQNLIKFTTNNHNENWNSSQVEELLRNTCIALSVLSEEEIVAKTLRSLNVVNHLVLLLNSPNEHTQIAAATIIANIRRQFVGGTSTANDVSVAHTEQLCKVLELPPSTFPLIS